jgi:hypothetical protein
VADKRRFIQILGEIGAGVGDYKKAELGNRIKAIQIVLSYGYGNPRVFDNDNVAAREELTLSIKRVVGIVDRDI